MRKHSAFYCSFCGKTQAETKVLISGPNVLICDECITLCVAVLQAGEAGMPGNCRLAFGEVLDLVKDDIRWMARCGEIEGVEV